MEEEEEVFQRASVGVVVNIGKEVCDATINIVVVISGWYLMFYSLMEALVEEGGDFIEDNCSEDGREGAALIYSLFHVEGLPRAVIPLKVDGSSVSIEEVGECGGSGYLQWMTSNSLSRDTRLNIFLRSRNTAALEGAWSFDCGTMMCFLIDSCMALMMKSMPWWIPTAQL